MRPVAISFGRDRSWGAVSQHEYRRMVQNPGHPLAYRVHFAAIGWADRQGHAGFEPGRLATLLGRNGKPLIGYARVSTDDQEAQLQRDALTAAGCVRIFEDKASGKNIDRPELTAVLDYARPGGVLCVWKLDRLGRSLIDLVSIVDGLRERGIGFRVLDGALSSVDTTSADGRLFFHIIAAMAEFERSLIKDRTRAGLEAAKAQGRTGGRPLSYVDVQR